MKYSSLRYLLLCATYFILFFASILIGFLITLLIPSARAITGFLYGAVFGGVFFLPSLIYYGVCFPLYAVLAGKKEPIEAVIYDWKPGRLRFTARAVLLIDDKQYMTPAFFSRREAKSFVGRAVTYCLIGDSVFLIDVA
ncbi:MAG: hypothetical protein ACI4U2_01950 [Christensenellaceae bacterium]